VRFAFSQLGACGERSAHRPAQRRRRFERKVSAATQKRTAACAQGDATASATCPLAWGTSNSPVFPVAGGAAPAARARGAACISRVREPKSSGRAEPPPPDLTSQEPGPPDPDVEPSPDGETQLGGRFHACGKKRQVGVLVCKKRAVMGSESSRPGAAWIEDHPGNGVMVRVEMCTAAEHGLHTQFQNATLWHDDPLARRTVAADLRARTNAAAGP
jgi:hypothetical protein